MLYKYRSFEDYNYEEIFTDAKVYFASPSEFNDPFESKPKIVGLKSLKDRQEYAKNYIKREHANLPFKKRAALERKFIIRLAATGSVKEDIHSLLEQYGILCLSREWDKILMWSHYSKSHTGFCIGLDFDEELDDDFNFASEVIYKDKFPEISPELFKTNDESTLGELFEATLLTKSTQWSYEKEVRYIKLRREGGNGVYEFKKQKIKEVILGARITTESRDKIINLIKNETPWVKIYQAVVSDSEYTLNRHETNG